MRRTAAGRVDTGDSRPVNAVAGSISVATGPDEARIARSSAEACQRWSCDLRLCYPTRHVSRVEDSGTHAGDRRLALGLAGYAGDAAVAAPKAAIVVDAKSGKVLYSDQPDASRYPASLTKMMTLYMLFASIDSGRTSFQDRDRHVAALCRAAADQARPEARPDDPGRATPSSPSSPSRPTTSPARSASISAAPRAPSPTR